MDRRWLGLIEQGGDADLGAALVRLARQAERVHAMEVARSASASAEPACVSRAGAFGGTDALRQAPRVEAARSVASADAEVRR